jgi:hypothetical protein
MGRAARANAARRRVPEIEFVNRVQDDLAAQIIANGPQCRSVVQPGSAAGQSLVIAGAGPSLAETAGECANADQVWGCNRALTWLVEHGHRVTHGFTVQQEETMCTVWGSMPPVEYLVASTVHPRLPQLLQTCGRRVTFFHNLVNLAEQDELYAKYPPTVTAGSGLNAVTRALDVAEYMGFASVTVLGADSSIRLKPGAPPRRSLTVSTPEYEAWIRDYAIMHVDGGNPIDNGCSPVTLFGTIDGREWVMQPDMAVSANWLARMVQASNGKIRLVGDGFAQAIVGKPVEFLDRLPRMTDERGRVLPFPI